MITPILLLGNQNAGKTTLFNALTGLNAKVANYPGVTVEAGMGQIKRRSGDKVTVVDLPGTYSLIPTSEEEDLSVNVLLGRIKQIPDHSLVVVVIDCSELRRGFYLYSQVIELGFKAIIALSMTDLRPEFKDKEVINSLQKAIGTLIVPVESLDKASVNRLVNTIDGVLSGSLLPQIKEQPKLFLPLSDSLIDKLSIAKRGMYFPKNALNSDDLIKNYNIYLYGLVKRNRLKLTTRDIDHLSLNKKDNEELDLLISHIPEHRFLRVDNWLSGIKWESDHLRKKSDLVDKFLLHPIFGSLFLLTLFIAMLQGLFFIAQPMADGLSSLIALLSSSLNSVLPQSSIMRSLLVDGVIEGVGSVLSFVPLIALLFFFLSVLEDSGYLARATYLLDSLLKKTGLCGRSLMPMLSGFACAVPAIMAARTIGNRKERLITILVTPFLTCSARLPVFGLIVGAMFSLSPPIFGFIDVGALIFIAMYVLGVLASLLSAMILSKILKSTDSHSLAIELPKYRLPDLSSVFRRVVDRIRLFIKDVGSVILASTIIVWAAFSFDPINISFDNQEVEHSFASIIGHGIEPAIKPLGLDWQVGVGIVASFLAREVFVSTMAVTYGLNDQDESSPQLKAKFKDHISPLSGFCLLIFFTLSMQCVSTMATTKKETGSLIWPALQFFMMTGSGYILAVIVYSLGSYIGLA